MSKGTKFVGMDVHAETIAVAVVDELNQSFNPARTSSLWDVMLDTAGGVAALLSYWLVARRRA